MGISPLRALWGVFRSGEYSGQRGVPHVVARPFDSPLRRAFQKREQFVRRPEFALAEARGNNRFNGLQLFSGVQRERRSPLWSDYCAPTRETFGSWVWRGEVFF
jgi:hypothetical protein